MIPPNFVAGSDRILRVTMHNGRMPVYRLQFTAESCLTSAADIAVPYAGVNVTFYCRMFPIIRPGSIVQIDQNQRKVLPRGWKDEDDGPIYFVELRGGFCAAGAN
jgi:hypothetical protein